MFRKKKNIDAETDENASKNSIIKKTNIKKKKRNLIIAAIVLVVAVATVWGLFSDKEQTLLVTTSAVERMDIEQVVTIKGTIKGSQSADVATALNYEIVSILVEEGDVVKKDQVLAILDADELKADYQKAISALNESKFKYEAAKNLYEEGAISKEEYIRAENAYKNDMITVNSLNVADKVNIKSPIAGTVTRVNVNIGRYANDTENNEPMFVVEDLQKLKMDVGISEYDISKIQVGQKVTITAEVLGNDSVEGIVSRISPTGEQKDAASKEMVIPVQIDINNEDSKLIAGVTAKAEIEIEKKNNVLSVPIDALLEDPSNGDISVIVLDETVLKKIPVQVGLEGDFHIEISSGDIKEGDLMVLNPTFDMADGMKAAPASNM
ncbi:MAG TPA: efflux RND transporter periplasmic adaptor subunit [Clostridiales bacterium]|nr:efflux RND transporter periplasmic adaptor subunit [Clostridiales bacterium]